MIRLLIASIFVVATTQACTCEGPKPYEYFFCKTPIVIRATIKPEAASNVPAKPGHNGYALEITDVFKNSTNDAVPTVVYSPDQSPACGYTFEHGKEYLIFGMVSEMLGMFTNLCSNNKKWDTVPADVKTQLDNGDLGKNCTST